MKNFSLSFIAAALLVIPIYATPDDAKQTTTPSAAKAQLEPLSLENVYSKVAPAVVIVMADRHGNGAAGFVAHPDGWIVTNYHVVDDARIDLETGALCPKIYFGKLDANGQMQPMESSVIADVYQISRTKDLALLKIRSKPAGMTKLPYIPLFEGNLKIGSSCVAVGHPFGGVTWAIRGGYVAGIGTFPLAETRNTFDLLEHKTGRPVRVLNGFLGKAILSDSNISWGDSGGPLVNRRGQLIGVNFLKATYGKNQIPGLNYHIHVAEVRSLLNEIPHTPTTPPTYIPDMRPPNWLLKNCKHEQLDLDGDGYRETLLFRQNGRTMRYYVNFSKPNPSWETMNLDSWKYHFVADETTTLPRAIYDSNCDGELDLLVSGTGGARYNDKLIMVRRHAGQWQLQRRQPSRMIDAAYFTDPEIRERFTKIIRKLNGRSSAQSKVILKVK